MKHDFDIIIIGGGGAGITAAFTSVGLGKKTALVEKRKIGGECTHSGCVPSKALIKSASVSHAAKSSEHYGFAAAEALTGKPLDYVQSVVSKIYENETPEVMEKHGVSVIEGEAQFVDANTVLVNEKKYTASKFLLACGSSPFVPPIEGLDTVDYLTNESVFLQDSIPESLIVMGGGPIGIEMAQAFARLGSKVSIIEMADRLLIREEKELSDRLTGILKQEGIDVLTSHKAVKVANTDGGVSVSVIDQGSGNPREVTGQRLLVAVGRKPNLGNLNPEKARLEMARTGIPSNLKMETSVKNIYAAGDITSPYQFSHMAEYQAIIAVLNAFLPVTFKADYKNIPWVTFTAPELAHIGLTEEEARGKYGDSIRVYHREYSTLDRANTDSNSEGVVKVILDKKGFVIGAHILGYTAGEILHQFLLIQKFKKKLSSVQGFIYAYPTYADIVKRIAREAYKDEIASNPFVKLVSIFRKKDKK
jgi:pyruvate/2-oxoglutarate dehydrogenase complex dihydrolipoamide dehydrogenase (E3) component